MIKVSCDMHDRFNSQQFSPDGLTEQITNPIT